ncbi:hypothetical protein KVA01_05650 [Kocuria varians]|uniref:Uncharacterized protein n=1 Tax=Kocuria varians TaxID=1272 RepID=A0A4Y4D6K4_KOCVA|nr:hypothetical protein [Kocuria varians]GEC98410.1 hypothetical protein KVA01_05650 [Kocuria varians]
MSEYPRDEFDDVPEDGARQGAHRGHNPNARNGSRREFRAILVTGVLALVLGTVCFVNAPRTEQGASVPPSPAGASALAPQPGGAAAAATTTTPRAAPGDIAAA